MQIVTKQTFAPNITTYTMKNGVFTLEEPPLFFGNNLNPQIARDSVINNHTTTKHIYLDSNKQPNTIYYLYDIKLRFPSNIFRTQKHITSIVIDSIQWDNTIQENHIIGIKRDSLYDNRITLLSLQDIGDSGIVGNVSYHVNLAESLFLNILVFYVIGGILLIVGIIIIKIPIIYNNTWHILSLVLISIGILVRISQYIWHKDLYVDEVALAFSLYALPFKDIFFQPLPYTQAAPLGFLSIAKLLGISFGYSEQVLYFFPFICGIGVLIVAYKIGRNIALSYQQFGEFFSFLFILFTIGSLGLVWYTTEFKQYGIEAFCSFLLLYLFIKNTSLRTFSLVSIVCILFSNTIIFIILACIVGYFYQARIQDSNKNFFTFSLSFIKTNGLYIGGILAFFLLYYILYIRYQAVQGFYTYWDKFFLPHSLNAYPQYFKEVWATTAARFTVFSATRFVPFYMTVSALGLLATYLCNRKLCIMMTLSIIIAIALSLLKIYPLAGEGEWTIGDRLALFMSPIFYLSCTYGIALLYNILQKIRLGFLIKTLMVALFIITCNATMHKMNPESLIQSHAMIKKVISDSNPKHVIMLWNLLMDYYLSLNQAKIDFMIPRGEKLEHIKPLVEKNLDNKSLYIFYFFNLKQWKQFLEKDILLNNNFQIIIYKDRGGMLIKIQPHNHIDL